MLNKVVVSHGRIVHTCGRRVNTYGPHGEENVRTMAQTIDRPTGLAHSDVETMQQRLIVALETAGLYAPATRDISELRKAWKRAYGVEIGRSTVWRWFGPTFRELESETLFRIADLTQVSARWILRGEGPFGRWIPSDPEKMAMLAIYDELSEPRRERWLDLGRDMLASQKTEPTAPPTIPSKRDPYPATKKRV